MQELFRVPKTLQMVCPQSTKSTKHHFQSYIGHLVYWVSNAMSIPILARSLAIIVLANNSLLAQGTGDSREYIVTVDSKASGRLTIDYVCNGDESISIDVRTSMQTRVLFMRYTYSLHVAERWIDGQLLSLKSKVNDNGTILTTKLDAAGSKSELTVNDQSSQQVSTCQACTTLAFQPRLTGNSVLRMLDVDSGKVVKVAWKDLGQEKIGVDGSDIACQRFRISDGAETQVWFDEHSRLVKQTFSDSGFQVVIAQVATKGR